MSITFNTIPLTINVPGSYVEFDSSRAVKGLQLQPHDVLIIAQMTSAGIATANTPVLCRSFDHAITLFGQHSQASQMVKSYKLIDSLSPVWVIPVSDNGAGTAATGSFVWTGTATAAGELPLYIGGRRVSVAVTVGMTAASLETAALAALALMTDLPVTYAADAAAGVDFTAKHKGTLGNEIKLGVALQPGESVPAGITVVTTQLTAGATNPSIATAISAMAEDQYQTVVLGITDATNVGLLVTELESRWGPTRQIDGVAFIAKADTQANLTTLGNTYNSPLLSLGGFEVNALSLTPWEIAAQSAAISGLQFQSDPSRDTVGLALQSSYAPRGTRFTFTERNTVLTDGVGTYRATSDGRMAIERQITTYQTNSLSVPDTSLRDLYLVRTLSTLRYTLRTRIGTKFARFKLADDGEALPSGQPIVTPAVLRAELLALFLDWRDLGWVENYTQFARELLVERDGSDPNRVNVILPPDIINNFLTFAAQVAFKR